MPDQFKSKNRALPEGSVEQAHKLLVACAVRLELEYPETTRQQWMVALEELAHATNIGRM